MSTPRHDADGSTLLLARTGAGLQSLERRFWAKVEKAGATECWLWTGCVTSKGYGQIRGEYPRRIVAHRVAYELLVEPVPEGLVLDHLCRNRRCVNPAHLEPVTERENILRGVGAGAIHARKTHCKHGHEFTPENTYVRPDRSGRQCRTCSSNRQAAKAA